VSLLHDLIDFGEQADALSRGYFDNLHNIADAEMHAAVHRYATSLRDTAQTIEYGIISLSKSARRDLASL
jgi:hypothetical protein